MSRRFHDLWRSPDFLKLWAGQTISKFGTRLDALGFTAVLVLGATPLQLGILTAVEAFPILVVGVAVGVWVDRMRRKPIMIAADGARALLLLSVPIAAWSGILGLPQLIVVGALVGVCSVFFDVAYATFVPTVVPRESLIEANSKLGLTGSLSEIMGPGLAGFLVQLLTAPTAVLVDAGTFVASAGLLGWLRTPERRVSTGRGENAWREALGGLRVLREQPILRALAGQAATANFFGSFIGTLYILYLVRVLGIGPAGVGLTIAVGGIGDLMGVFLAPSLARRFGIGWTLLGASLFIAVIVVIFPLAGGSVALATGIICCAQLVGDVGHGAFDVHAISVRQSLAPEHLLGRVNAAMEIVSRGVVPIGLLTGGVLGQTLGIRPTLWIAVLGIGVSTLWLIFSPLRTLRDLPVVAGVLSAPASSPPIEQ